MGFQSKTYSLSDEVIEALEQLKAEYGSYNKGLRAVLIDRLYVGTLPIREGDLIIKTVEPVERPLRQKGDKTR